MTEDISYADHLAEIITYLGLIAFSSAILLLNLGASLTTLRKILWGVIDIIHLGFWIIIGPVFFLDLLPTIYFPETTKELLKNTYITYGLSFAAFRTADNFLSNEITEEDNEKLIEKLNDLNNQRQMSQ